VAVWGGMLFSDPVAFVGAAAFGALLVVQLSRRAWRRLAETAVTAGCTAVLMLAVYKEFDARADYPGLKFYWSAFYLPAAKGLHADLEFVTARFHAVGAYFGLGPVWLVFLLVVAGLVTIFRLGRPATAVAVAVLWPELLALSALRQYPFLDERTSTFLFAISAAVGAIGLAGVCSLLLPRVKGLLAGALAAIALVLFVAGAAPYVRIRTIPNEDVRDQVGYIAAREARGDMILVNLSSNWGFAYYWRVGDPAARPSTAVAQGYEAYFPDQRDIVVARNRNLDAIDEALAQALAAARQGADAARSLGSTTTAGPAAAIAFARRASGYLLDPSASATASRTTVTVTVTGTVPSFVPGLPIGISETAQAPIEQFQP